MSMKNILRAVGMIAQSRIWYVFAVMLVSMVCRGDGVLDIAVRGHSPEYAIVRAKDASPSVVYAAEELRDFTERMTGVRLEIVTDDKSMPPKAVVLGRTRWSASLPAVTDGLGEDGFLLKVKPPHLLVIGSDVRGVLYGVYELLERFGGCRWYASWHTVVPTREAFSVPADLDEVHNPAFLCRDVHWWDYFNGDLAVRNRANGGMNGLKERHGGNTWRFGGGLGNCHTFETLLPPRKYFDKHPEYYSLVDGKRLKERSQLCLTNPDVLRLVTSNVLARIRSDPCAKFYGVSQNDWNNWCECSSCKAVDDEEKSHAGTMIRFVNAIAEAVEKEFPDKIIETLAYEYTRHAPAKTRLRHNVIPCLCSIECDFSRPLDKSPCPDNVSFLKDIANWSRQTDSLYVWDYVTDFRCYPHPFPNVQALQGNVKFFRKHGVKMLFEQGASQGRHAGFAELKGWLLAKWMWNPDLPAEPLLADFFEGYYGKAAPFVRAVFDEANRREAMYVAEDATHVLKIYEDVTAKSCREALDDSFVAWAQAQMKLAEDAVRNEPSVYSYNVRMTSFSFDYIRLERLRRGVRLDFTKRSSSCASVVDSADEMRGLAQSLLARMDEAKDIRITNDDAKHRQAATLRRWKALANGESVAKRRESVPFGTIPDVAFKINREGEWAELCNDPAAIDGQAVRISNVHSGWPVSFDLDNVTFCPGRKYVLKVRVRVVKRPGRSGSTFWAGVYSNAAQKGRGQITVTSDAVSSDGYVWYDVLTWMPGCGEYFWIGVAPFDRSIGSAVEDVWMDEMLLIEKSQD